MPAHPIARTLERYAACVSAGDVEGIVALYAPDATIEIPAGSGARRGIDAIRAFYSENELAERLVVTGAVCAAGGEAAVPMRATLRRDGRRFEIDVIDVVRFDAQGRLTSLRAFFDLDPTGAPAAPRAAVVPPGAEVQYSGWKLSPALRVGNVLYCSGQIGMAADGSIPAEAEQQIALAFENLGAVLAAAGAGFGDVVELTSFHVGLQRDLDAFVAVRDRFLREPWPAQTAVGVAELGVPGLRIELRAVAVLGG